jgi:transposase-like protein
MSGYDGWLTTPPDDRGYCPYCYADSEDAARVCENDWDVYRCAHCGSTFAEPLTHNAMVREASYDARLDRDGA